MTKVILIGNYLPDRQESMLRFARMLSDELVQTGIGAQTVAPSALISRGVANPAGGLGKWLAYVDKYVVFPFLLAGRRVFGSDRDAVYHICDHSNAPYVWFLPRERTLVTCHDVLAIRGAKGDPAAWCRASGTGKVLQEIILHALRCARHIACDSAATQSDLLELAGDRSGIESRIIYPCLNAPFEPLEKARARCILEEVVPAGVRDRPFLLSVGSALPRKNRIAVLHTLALAISDSAWEGNAVFAGARMSADERRVAQELGVEDRVIEVRSPSHEQLNALYCLAYALVHLAWSEGFGWPVIEAQASGCPVICSNRTSVPEVAGEGAIVLDPDDWNGAAAAVIALRDPGKKKDLIEKGFVNLRRFEREKFVEGYLEMYGELGGGERKK